MSGRVLLAIGCDIYDNPPLSTLNGAEADARAIYDALIEPKIGEYEQIRSYLLLSPKLQDVRDALTKILFGDEPPQTLTVFFAGHGAVIGGSFYMAMRDSLANALSATALSLADLFRMVAEAKPTQTYLIIDACQAGGLIADLNVVLKSDVMGRLGTPGITLLASAASNENALESDGKGIGTTALLDCIRGDIFLQDSTPALDLVEIGRVVSQRVSAAGGQTPVVWGLNLYGPSSFCKNPHAGTGNAPLRSVQAGWLDSKAGAAIRDSLPGLWGPYVSLASHWDPREFVDRLTPVLAELAVNPTTLIDFSHRIAEAFAAQCSDSADPFREIEVRAACLAALLPYSGTAEVAAYLTTAGLKLANKVILAIRSVRESIETYKYALVTGGLSDLYYLPIRLSKLLGWAGYAVHAHDACGSNTADAASELAEMLATVLAEYPLSVVAMCDAQAPFIMSALTAAIKIGATEPTEEFIGRMFTSAVDCRGRVARADLEGEFVLTYLLARHNRMLESDLSKVAQPTELITVILIVSYLLRISDEIDRSMDLLDHIHIIAYLPDDYKRFYSYQIEGGNNAVLRVGHDFWTVADLEEKFPVISRPENSGEYLASIASSLLFPDRTPWFLIEDHR